MVRKNCVLFTVCNRAIISSGEGRWVLGTRYYLIFRKEKMSRSLVLFDVCIESNRNMILFGSMESAGAVQVHDFID